MSISKINIEENLLLKNHNNEKFYYYDDMNGIIIEKDIYELYNLVANYYGYIYIYSKN